MCQSFEQKTGCGSAEGGRLGAGGWQLRRLHRVDVACAIFPFSEASPPSKTLSLQVSYVYSSLGLLQKPLLLVAGANGGQRGWRQLQLLVTPASWQPDTICPPSANPCPCPHGAPALQPLALSSQSPSCSTAAASRWAAAPACRVWPRRTQHDASVSQRRSAPGGKPSLMHDGSMVVMPLFSQSLFVMHSLLSRCGS